MFETELFVEVEEVDDEFRGASIVTSLPTCGDDNKLVIESIIFDFMIELQLMSSCSQLWYVVANLASLRKF